MTAVFANDRRPGPYNGPCGFLRAIARDNTFTSTDSIFYPGTSWRQGLWASYITSRSSFNAGYSTDAVATFGTDVQQSFRYTGVSVGDAPYVPYVVALPSPLWPFTTGKTPYIEAHWPHPSRSRHRHLPTMVVSVCVDKPFLLSSWFYLGNFRHSYTHR